MKLLLDTRLKSANLPTPPKTISALILDTLIFSLSTAADNAIISRITQTHILLCIIITVVVIMRVWFVKLTMKRASIYHYIVPDFLRFLSDSTGFSVLCTATARPEYTIIYTCIVHYIILRYIVPAQAVSDFSCWKRKY